MRILITGGCGYIGCSLVQELAASNAVSSVIIYDNLFRNAFNTFIGKRLANAQKIRFQEGDILDSYSLKKALVQSDVVIHLAALVSTPFADHNAHGFDQVNNWGTCNLSLAIEEMPNICKVIYCSSLSVYGDTAGSMVDESSPTSPKTFYGLSKLRGEKHIKRLSVNKDVFIFRLGNVFGYNPNMRLDAVINRFMFDAQFKGKIEIYGSGEQKRSFIDVKSVSRYMLKVCTELHPPGLFNLVKYNLSILEIVELLKLIYPSLETIRLDQHLRMRSITASSKHHPNLELTSDLVSEHLDDIKEHFSY